MKKLKITGIVLFMLFSMKGFSQEVPKGFEVTELVKIAEVYQSPPHLSYHLSVTYADSAQPNNILEEVQGMYKIREGKYWFMLDSIEFLQGDQYNLAVYHPDSTIMVNKLQEPTSPLQLPLMDSFFHAASVASIAVTRVNDSTRLLKILFKPEAYYRSYEMQYDLNTFLIRKIKYYLMDAEALEEPNSSGVVCVALDFSNYSTAAVNEDYFNETKFIHRQGGQLVVQPAFAGYQLIMGDNE